MSAPAAFVLTKYIARAGFTSFGDSIREQRVGNLFPTPEAHFLIYFNDTGRIDARRMWDPMIDNIVASEIRLFNIARGTRPHGSYLGRSFRNMLWRHPCYITIVLENEGCFFNFDPDVSKADGDPIEFVDKDGGRLYDPNFSFYNAERVEVPLLDVGGQLTGETRNGIRFTNHLKADKNGLDLTKEETRSYKMNLVIWKPDIDDPRRVTKTYTDPDGTNQGPPDLP